MLPNYHIIAVVFTPWTETRPDRIVIKSLLHGNKKELSVTDNDTITTAANYLQDNGFDIVGQGEGQPNVNNIKTMYLISDTFKKF